MASGIARGPVRPTAAVESCNMAAQEGGVNLLAQLGDCAAEDLSHYDVTSKFQWPLKDDTRKVFHPMIAQRI